MLGEIQSIIEEHPSLSITIMGDFNVGDHNAFGFLLNDFCADKQIIVSDIEFLPRDSFTFVNNAHCSVSWVDHCLTMFNAHKSIQQIEVDHNFGMSRCWQLSKQ